MYVQNNFGGLYDSRCLKTVENWAMTIATCYVYSDFGVVLTQTSVRLNIKYYASRHLNKTFTDSLL